MRARDKSRGSVSLPQTPDAAPPASWVERSPDVCGGDACIRKTRITVWGLVEWRSLGLSDAEILQHLPDLTQMDLEAAWEYYGQHHEEIDQAIRENLDEEQVLLGTSDRFWELIRERRSEKTVSRAELEQKFRPGDGRQTGRASSRE
jgi:uncharacterized protein (DUF433 family)